MTPTELMELLQARGISWQLTEHAPVWTMADARTVRLPACCQPVKNLLITDDRQTVFALLTLPAQARADLKALRPLLSGRRLTFASNQALQDLLGLAPGSVTPFGLLNAAGRAIPWLVSKDLAGRTIGLHPLRNTATLSLRTEDAVRLLEEKGVQVVWIW
jgi:Ala-tRNA(Pro) deacylase